MTLKTHVALTGPIDVGTAFDLALRAILDAAGTPDKYMGARYRTLSHHGRTTHRTVPDQGLPALTDATARSDGTQLDLTTHLKDALAGWTLTEQTCSALVSWDTAHGFHANALHAAAIVLLCDSLPADVELHWKNEATGTWHLRWTGIRALTGSASPSVTIAEHIRTAHTKEPRA